MVFIERLERKGKEYYYVSKNFRVGVDKWKRIKKYAGTSRPSKDKIKEIAEEIEKEAIKKGLKKQVTKFKYLTDEQAEVLEDLKQSYVKWWKKLPKNMKEKYENDFLVRFTYNSNAIEGNTLSLRDTNLILQDRVIPSDINENEYKEVINGEKAMKFVKEYNRELNETFLLKIHKLLVENILESAGRYRNHEVIIQGSNHTPPNHEKVSGLMKKMFVWYNNNKNRFHPLELAGLIHTKFVRIHPFADGNGRTARIIMNFLLYKNKYPMFLIENTKRKQYYEALEESDAGKDKPFINLLFNNIIQQHKKL
jgi:Fic family protein